VYQHGADDSGGFNQPFETAQGKPAKAGQRERLHREAPADSGRSREKLPNVGDDQKLTADL